MKKFIINIIQKKLKDVIVTGYIDAEDAFVFHPLYERLFFIFDDSIYELYLDNGLIKSKKIDRIKIWFDLDEDDLFAQMSIYSQLFKTEQEINVSRVNYSKVPCSNMCFFYHEGDVERKLIFETNSFFGFVFL